MASPLENAMRLVRPGEMVVPVAAILDKLGDKLTADEKQQLLVAILSRRTDQVRPGDLITADVINQILVSVEDLNVRVLKIESAAPPPSTLSILSVTPAALRVGEELTVKGVNLPGDPTGKVDIGGIGVKRFSVANASRLVFAVPGGYTDTLPADLVLTIRNGSQSDTELVRILPEDSPLKGKVVVTPQTQSLPEIKEGLPYEVEFSVDSQTNIAEKYELEVQYSDVSGTASSDQWSNATDLVDKVTGKKVVNPVLVEPGNPKRFKVAFTIPSGAKTATLVLRATSTTKPDVDALNQPSNPPYVLEVGNEVVSSDPRTTFAIQDFGSLSPARKATIDGKQGVEIRFGKQEFVTVWAIHSVKGTYDYTMQLVENTDGWLVGAPDPIQSTEVAGEKEEIGISVESLGTTSPQRTLIVKSKRRKDADGDAFESWREIPIRGF